MRIIRVCGLLLSVAWCSCSAATVPEKHITDRVSDKAVFAFFADCLASKTVTFAGEKALNLWEIEQQRQWVWEIWKAANGAFAEEKLIDLKPLSETSSGRWVLPESLERDAVMPYYWGTKGNNKPKEGFPLYLYLHGSGDKHQEWATGLTLCTRFDDAPSVYFIPQIPNEGEYYRWWQKAKQFAWEKLLRQALVSGQIDPDRMYIFGISEGGYGSQRLASFYADYLAGAGPMAGGEPLKNAPPENCRNIAFSLLTGADDKGFYRNTLTSYVQEAFRQLHTQDPEHFMHRIELIPGKGHSIDYGPTTPWLKQHVRNPHPKHVTWEDYEMDGRHRQGFYNLYLPERTDNAGRKRYEMNITDNTIALQIDDVTYETVETDPHWGIEMKFKKHYTPSRNGRLILYLCNELVDLNREITVTANGEQVFKGATTPDLKHLINSCARFFDPHRLYPVAVEVVW
ncbi:MAG: hypothetical protein ACTTKI_08570 [Tannerella sp.]|uniref:carboxylesterase family protein n=1 Tax=Tannerella sp. TaxID=2382127 RepID=UPI003FA240C6